jgi:hypothetical protein
VSDLSMPCQLAANVAVQAAHKQALRALHTPQVPNYVKALIGDTSRLIALRECPTLSLGPCAHHRGSSHLLFRFVTPLARFLCAGSGSPFVGVGTAAMSARLKDGTEIRREMQ